MKLFGVWFLFVILVIALIVMYSAGSNNISEIFVGSFVFSLVNFTIACLPVLAILRLGRNKKLIFRVVMSFFYLAIVFFVFHSTTSSPRVLALLLSVDFFLCAAYCRLISRIGNTY